MKMIESRNAQMNSTKVRLQFAPAAGNRGRIGSRQVHGRSRFAQRVDPIGHRESGRHASSQRHHPLPVESIDSRRTDAFADLD